METRRQHLNTALMYAQTPKTITRSRNGCAVCKSKRLKCDEAKPGCSRCKRLGIACPGYQKSLKWAGTPAARKRSRNASDNATSELSPGWIGSTGGSLLAQPEQHAIDMLTVENTNQYSDIIEPDDISLTEYGNFGSLFSFEEPPQDPTLQLEPTQAPSTSTMPRYPDQQEDELWPSVLSNSGLSPVDGQLNAMLLARNSTSNRETPLAKSLQDHTTVLVEYYFKEVCGMMSCYDSQMNPYRSTISNVWSGSMTLYYTTQSMAAACLSEVSPALASVGRQLRDQAILCLTREAKDSKMQTPYLLSLVMLGMSLSWHDPEDVGKKQFEMLADMDLSPEHDEQDLPLVDRQRRLFFYNSLIYWKMLLAFVTDNEYDIPTPRYCEPQPSHFAGLDVAEQRMPHPQTGIGIDVQKLVAKVGSIVRKERKRIRSRRFASRRDIDEAQKAINDAERLHAELCAIDLPQESSIIDSGDEMTPTAHLLKVAEAYRCTGLLQLYRNFPDLLLPFISSPDSTQQPTSIDLFSHTNPGPSDEAMARSWLVCLALHILDLIEDIPISSRSRSIQPLLLVSICSDLAVGRGVIAVTESQLAPVVSIASSPRFKAPPTDLDILRARKSLVSRLSSLENILAAKPIRRMLQLVHETWACMENSTEDVYWMDVMIDKGYETLMG